MDFVWWYYPVGVLVALLVGGMIASIGFYVHSYFQSKKLKKNIGLPKGKEEVSKWLQTEEVKKQFIDGGKANLMDKKEAEEDDRTKFNEYREFEKLRRATQKKPTVGAVESVGGQGIVQDELIESDESDSRTVELDE